MPISSSICTGSGSFARFASDTASATRQASDSKLPWRGKVAAAPRTQDVIRIIPGETEHTFVVNTTIYHFRVYPVQRTSAFQIEEITMIERKEPR